MKFDIEFFGHKNIRSLHQKTVEITKDSHLTPSGDCIIGVRASCGCNDIPNEMKNKIKNPNSQIKLLVKVADYTFKIIGWGHKNLDLSHPHDIVVRKSSFVCPRTLAIKCDRVSDSIPREMIKLLQNPSQKAIFSIEVC